MKRLPALAIMAASLLLAGAQAQASCIGFSPAPGEDPVKGSLLRQYQRSNAVFVGEVTGFDYVPSFKERPKRFAHLGNMETVLVKLAPARWWKGEPVAEVRLDTGTERSGNGLRSSSSVEYRFEVGKTYLVFAHMVDGRLSTSICSGNRAIQDAAPAIALLDELRQAGQLRSDDGSSPVRPVQ